MKLKDLDRLADRELIAELNLMRDGLSGNEADYNVTAADTTALTNSINAYETSVDTVDTKRAEKTTAVGDRDNKRGDTQALVRNLEPVMRNAVGNDPEKLGKINLTPYDTTLSSADAPASAPFALIDFGVLRHTINFRDSATPETRKKPDGVLGCEIWSKVGGEAAETEADFSMVALDTATPYIAVYTMADKGKSVWYRLRWAMRSGEKGPWGETVEATING